MTASSAAPVLAVEGIGKSFKGFRAVDRVSFAVDAGELLALIGPNGAGKTTTFNMINGQLAPDHGRVLLRRPRRHRAGRRARCGDPASRARSRSRRPSPR